MQRITNIEGKKTLCPSCKTQQKREQRDYCRACEQRYFQSYYKKNNIKYLIKHGLPIVDSWIKKRNNSLTKDFLFKNYVEEHLSLKTISKMMGCDDTTIATYLRKFKINIRKSGVQKGFVQSKKQIEKRRRTLTGEQCYLWKGGISPLHDLISTLPQSVVWRKKVFSRDNYTCQDCGQWGKKLNAHHIKAFSILFNEFLQYYSQFSPIEDKETLVRLATTWEPFWDLVNGKTVCCDCHKKYGTKRRKSAKN